jgi:hypothetical protein
VVECEKGKECLGLAYWSCKARQEESVLYSIDRLEDGNKNKTSVRSATKII